MQVDQTPDSLNPAPELKKPKIFWLNIDNECFLRKAKFHPRVQELSVSFLICQSSELLPYNPFTLSSIWKIVQATGMIFKNSLDRKCVFEQASADVSTLMHTIKRLCKQCKLSVNPR